MKIGLDLSVLEKKIGYVFKDKTLLEQAMKHRSVGKINNERLEFLGDAILNFTVADILYHHFPTAVEGELSRLRAFLVKEESLYRVALALEIGAHLVLGVGEMKSGGDMRASILADAVEAVIAAIYLDSDITVCQQRIAAWLHSDIGQLSLDQIQKDPKSCLQEFLQAQQVGLPKYELIGVAGKEHAQIFTVACLVDLLEEPVQAQGTSRRRAEQAAAELVLQRLNT